MIDLTIRVESDHYIDSGKAQKDLDAITSNSILELTIEAQLELYDLLQMRPAGVYLSANQTSRPSTGYYRSNVYREMVNSMHGRVDDSGVFYGPWLEGTDAKNVTSRFKGYGVFRRVAQSIAGQVMSTFSRNFGLHGWKAY